MHRDYRQSTAFQELLRSAGAKLVEVGNGEAGCVVASKFLPWLRVLVAAYVRDPGALTAIEELARTHRALVVNVVPGAQAGSDEGRRWEDALAQHGYRRARFGAAPTKTILLDIAPGADELLRGMKEKTRYNVRLAQRRGLSATAVDARALLSDGGLLDRFYAVYEQNCRRVGVKPESRRDTERFIGGLQDHVFVVFVRSAAGEDLAVALHVAYDGTVVYELNGSTDEGRKTFAPTLAVWEGILEGKRRGCARYDFGGSFDERFRKAQKKWKGFTQFKEGFGGVEVAYVGSFSRWLPFLRRRTSTARTAVQA